MTSRFPSSSAPSRFRDGREACVDRTENRREGPDPSLAPLTASAPTRGPRSPPGRTG